MTSPTSNFEDRYEILDALSGSSLFAVFSARDTSTGAIVEVRRPRALALDDTSGLSLFRGLMANVAQVRHPNLTEIYEVGGTGGDLWIAYTPAEDDPLRDWLVRGLELLHVLDLGAQVADALDALHQADLYHGDVTSRHVYVLANGDAQLRDAGMAALSSALGNVMRSSLQVPQPSYMAPELLRGGAPSRATDIFSLGMVLYEAVTGYLPFTGNSQDTVRIKQQEAGIARAGSLNSAVPEGLDTILTTALAWEPSERYHSAAELADALRSLRASLSSNGESRVVPDAKVREAIRVDIAQFDPYRVTSGLVGREDEFRVCDSCLTVNAARAPRCAVCWRDLAAAEIMDRQEGELYAVTVLHRRRRKKWIRRGSIAGVALVLVALFFFDQSAPPGLLTGPPTSTLTAEAGPGLWTSPRGGAEASGAVVRAPQDPSGAIRWERDLNLAPESAVVSSPTVADGRMFITTGDARILALDVADGSTIWEVAAPGPLDSAVIIAGDRVFVAFRNSMLVSLDAATGEQHWASKMSNPLFTWITVDDGIVYVACQDGVIQTFDAITGELRWEIDTDGGISAPPAVSEGFLIVPTQAHRIHIYAGLTGQTRLIYVLPRAVDGSAAIQDGVAIIGGSDRHVRAIDIRAQSLPLEKTVLRWWTQFFIWGMAPFPPAQSGVVWTDNLYEEVRTHPAIAGNRAVVSTQDGNLVAYSVAAGDIFWTVPLEDEPAIPGSPTIVNDTVYVGTEKQRLHAMRIVDGTRLWSLELGGEVTGIPGFADGSLYVVTTNGIVYALD